MSTPDARRLSAVLEPVIGAVYFAPENHQAYKALGFEDSGGDLDGVQTPDGVAYFTSRGSALGQASGPVVAAAFGVFSPAVVTMCVDAGWAITDAATIAAARVNATGDALQRVLGDPGDAVATMTEDLERAAEPLQLPGRALYAGLRGLGPQDGAWAHLHWAGDLLREYRGDSHNMVWAARGYSACEIGLLSESYWGLPLQSYSRTRGWSDAEFDAALSRLRSLGLLDDSGLTEAGRDERESIEVETDRLCQPALDALGDRLEPVIETLADWARQMQAAKCYPVTGPQDLAKAATR